MSGSRYAGDNQPVLAARACTIGIPTVPMRWGDRCNHAATDIPVLDAGNPKDRIPYAVLHCSGRGNWCIAAPAEPVLCNHVPVMRHPVKCDKFDLFDVLERRLGLGASR